MARHAATSSHRPAKRALLRAGLTVTAAGAALGVGGAGAAAAVEPGPAAAPAGFATPLGAVDAGMPLQVLSSAVHHSTAGGLGPVKNLQLDPLANTSADPLDNTLGTQIADFKPVSTGFVTGPLTQGASLADLPALGPVTKLLPG
ncbi:hypothetical protein ABZ953_03550 [Streptomyces sp. NPDC046465]|uniref:hypothetical protein n=1 Tax=Streptomyces sp. NPDC046465 TaxID=3155810 RepID=UPI003400BC71